MKVSGGSGRLPSALLSSIGLVRQLVAILVAFSTGHVSAESISEMRFVHLDHLGTVQIITDEQGNVVSEQAQLPFGAPSSVSGVSGIDFQFPGQRRDEETRLHYNIHRYYDPETGRYLTGDPLGVMAGVNLYVYASANPVRYSDPTGLIHDGSPCLIPGECECVTAECAARILPNPTNPCVETCLVQKQMVEPLSPGNWGSRAQKAYPWQLRAGITITKYLTTLKVCHAECASKRTQLRNSVCFSESPR